MKNERCITRFTRPFRGEAAGLKTPAASHRPLPYFGYVPWVKFKLFVHYSFIIRSLFVLIRALCKGSQPKDMSRYLGATFGSLGSILGSFEAILEALEGILGGLGGLLGSSWVVLGGLGALLGGSWGGLGRSCGDLKATLGAVHFMIVFFMGFGRQKGAQREAIWESKWNQNRSQNEVEI